MDETSDVTIQFAASGDPVETGLVTAAVTPPPQIPAAVSTPMPAGWTLSKVAALVLEVVQEIYDLPFLLQKYGLSQAQYDFLANNEFFKSALETRTIEWHSASNTQKRLALQTAIAIEEALPTITARMVKPTEPLSDIVALLKVFAEIAGAIGVKAQQSGPSGEKFKIILNLGADVIQREATPNLVTVQSFGEGEASPKAIHALLETARVPAAIPSNPKGQGGAT